MAAMRKFQSNGGTSKLNGAGPLRIRADASYLTAKPKYLCTSTYIHRPIWLLHTFLSTKKVLFNFTFDIISRILFAGLSWDSPLGILYGCSNSPDSKSAAVKFWMINDLLRNLKVTDLTTGIRPIFLLFFCDSSFNFMDQRSCVLCND